MMPYDSMNTMTNWPMNTMYNWPMSSWSPLSNWGPMTNWPMTNWGLSSNWMTESTMMPFSPMFREMNNWMRHMLPNEMRDVVFRPTNMIEYNTFVNPVSIHPDGSRHLHLCFDVKGYKPEEVKIEVTPKERCITVEAKHEVKEKDHHVTRHYMRKFVVPEELNVDLTKCNIKSCYTPDGLLVVESILPRITVEELKVIREKTATKTATTPYTPIMSPVGHAISIPIKMN